MVWQARVPERYPEAIVSVESVEDVQAAVRLARDEGLLVAVRSGGHNWAGACLRDGSLLVDLSRLDRLELDAAGMRASIGPGVTNGQLSAALQEASLGFPVGHSRTVGLGGYLLAGGLGWNPLLWGPASANVTEIEVVTADGSVVNTDNKQNTDLLWASRGAGPGFPGIVTRFELRLHPLPRAITGSTCVYPLARVATVSAWLAELLPSLPPEVEVAYILRSGPPRGASWSSRGAVVAPTVFAESREEAARLLAPFDTCPVTPLFAETAIPLAYADIQGRAYLPEDGRYAVDTIWSDDPVADVGNTIAGRLEAAPSERCAVVLTMRPPLPDERTAFTMYAQTNVCVYTIWGDEREDEANIAWHRGLMADLQPHSVGEFIPEVDLSAPGADASRSYTPETWARLEAVRRRFDPDRRLCSYLGPVSTRA
jgi:FAD/FMN-containing dehydrogenase